MKLLWEKSQMLVREQSFSADVHVAMDCRD